MENDRTSNTQNENSTQAATTTATHGGQSKETSESSNNKKENWFSKLNRNTKEVTKDITFVHLLEICAFGVGCVVAGIYYYQLQEMSAQTRLLGEQANRSVIENIGNAISTKRQLDALQQQTKAAQDSVRTIQKQFRLQQRPVIRIIDRWLLSFPDGAKITNPEIGKPFHVSIHFQNVGMSDALKLRVHYHILLGSQASQFKIEPEERGEDAGAGDVLERGGESVVSAVSLREPYSREEVHVDPEQVMGWDGTAVWVLGRISYEDVYGTKYCLPYMNRLLPTGAWGMTVTFNFQGKRYKTSQLCPPDTQR